MFGILSLFGQHASFLFTILYQRYNERENRGNVKGVFKFTYMRVY
ncbi:hypothetical protein SAMN04488072_108154 [Lentibacillus halodurans]|uniref:Uncharacterized protein n=1 Tax=Lentibacillus halodurans TaxID=237679 RepID=A0A1I0YSK1_9BACI|nr:hypothetical protein SAMN04488072_108154 [Lentibacillus halodurans]